LLNAWALAVANPIGVLRMADTPKKIDASGLAGGLIAASLLKKLVASPSTRRRRFWKPRSMLSAPIWLPRTDTPPRK
jgi:hypothetical protein